MRKLLYIVYYFPPDGGGGTQRGLKFCKYLPEFGWMPTVLTRQCKGGRKWSEPEDRSLLEELPPEVRVIRVGTENTDKRARWRGYDMPRSLVEAFIREACRMLAAEPFDAVFISMSPFALCSVGADIRKQFDVPVIYDLRDPWALDGWRDHPTVYHWYRDWMTMRRTLRGASGIVANTPESARVIKTQLNGAARPSLEMIPNGYDETDFFGVRPRERAGQDRRFRLAHGGLLYSFLLYQNKTLFDALKSCLRYRPEPIVPAGRSEYFLYKAIRILRSESHPVAQSLQLIFMGATSDAALRCAQDAGMLSQVEFTGYLEHRALIQNIVDADALFLPLHGLPTNRRSLIIPGKTYEYLASGTPILGALPPGDARDLVVNCDRGYVADPCCPHSIADALRSLYNEGTAKRDVPTNNDWLRRFERKELTRRLAAFLEACVARKHGANRALHEEQPEYWRGEWRTGQTDESAGSHRM